MNNFIIIISIFTAVVILQIFLSLRSNKYLGLIIPCINLLGSVFISLQFSSLLAAVLGFAISLVPIVIWIVIYAVCKENLEKKKQVEIKRMQINDL